MHRQLLAGNHEVGEHDGGLDHPTAVHGTSGFDEPFMEEIRLDAVDHNLGAVGVFLAEVVGARRQCRHGLVAGKPSAGAHEVRRGVVALRESPADLGLDVLLAVHPVPAETLTQVDHGRRPRRAEQLVELDHRLGHGGKCRVPTHT